VSGVGDDVNPCSRTAPCKTFAGAYSKTAIAGEINCLDPGGFGAVTISKSLAIKCDYVAEAGVLVAGTNAIVINGAAADVIWLSGLDFFGVSAALNGVKINSGGAVHVSDCWFQGFTAGGADGNGILLTNSGTTKLFVDNTTIVDNTNVGIEVKPLAGASASVTIHNVRAANNGVGFRANGTLNSASINMAISNSVAMGSSGAGINATSGTGPAQLMILNSTVSNNGVGLATGGSVLAQMKVGYSTITENGTSFTANGGSQIFSYGNNEIDFNASNPLPATTPLH
jgi:hypothetical protein